MTRDPYASYTFPAWKNRARSFWVMLIAVAIVTITLLLPKPSTDPIQLTQARLREISMALTLYAVRNDRAYPTDLLTLVDEGYLKPEDLIVPMLGDAPQGSPRAFRYIPGYYGTDNPSNLIVYPPLAEIYLMRDQVPYLRLDGATLVATVEAFQAMLNPAVNEIASIPAEE